MNKTTTISIIVLAALTLGACGSDSSNGVTVDPEEKPAGEKQAELPPNTVLLDVTCPSDSEIDQNVLTALSEENRQKVERIPVPVLLPSDPELLENGLLMPSEHGYTFTGKKPNASEPRNSVSINSSRLMYEPPGTETDLTDNAHFRGLEGFIGSSEIGMRATWSEYGVGYALSLSCYDGPDTGLCSTDETVREIVEGLAYVGCADTE